VDKTGRRRRRNRGKKGQNPRRGPDGGGPGPRKKALIKKLVDRKDRRIEVERGEEKPSKWREERKAAPVKMKKTQLTTPKAIKRRIRVGEAITVGELASGWASRPGGHQQTHCDGPHGDINQAIDFDTATLIATDFGYQVESAQAKVRKPSRKSNPPRRTSNRGRLS